MPPSGLLRAMARCADAVECGRCWPTLPRNASKLHTDVMRVPRAHLPCSYAALAARCVGRLGVVDAGVA
eukprot:8748285-Alexandrium_andersonii.AAC.1